MKKYEEVYSWNAFNEVKDGKQVYALDKKTKEVLYVNGITVFELSEIINSEEKDRYEFWMEESEEIAE